jgi:hypothetical protein
MENLGSKMVVKEDGHLRRMLSMEEVGACEGHSQQQEEHQRVTIAKSQVMLLRSVRRLCGIHVGEQGIWQGTVEQRR